MKTLCALLLTSFVFSTGAHADLVLACKKRNPLVYSSFSWVEIESNADGTHHFYYGIGISDQMLEITYSSPITRVSETEFRELNPYYELTAVVRAGKLNFSLKSARGIENRKGYHCEDRAN